jgi:hypothetical protein
MDAQDFVLTSLAVAVGFAGFGIGKEIASSAFDKEPITVCLPIENMPTVVCVKGEERHP